MPIKKQNKKRGGARPGSGPKRVLEGGRFRPVYMDDSTAQVMTEIGGNNLSRGIRLMAIVWAIIPDPQGEEYLERARNIEKLSQLLIRETQKRKEEE